MTYYEMRPPLLDKGDGLEDCKATTLSNSEHRVTARPRQVLWLARRGRVSIAYAAVLVEANHLGGV